MRALSLIVAGFVALVAAHPGHDHIKEAQDRRAAMLNARTSLGHCQDSMHESGLARRAIERRAALARKHMKRSLEGRQKNHGPHQSNEKWNANTDLATVFGGNHSCVLTPAETEGPFYVTGESLRKDIVETQEGIPLILDFQLIDVNTCKPVEGAAFEVWNANATGVYSGVVSALNGAGLQDQANLEKTFLRGFQMTDAHGTVQFKTLFPGHYTGRTVHVHVMAHIGVEKHPNGTISSTSPAHVGQLYFDQDLIMDVKASLPYSTNRQQMLTNARDYVLLLEPAGSDPFFHYTMLGDKVTDGLLGWFSFGIDPKAHKTVAAAANHWEGKSRMNRIQFGNFPSPGGAGRGG